MKKKFLSMVLVGAMVLSLCACGKSKSVSNNDMSTEIDFQETSGVPEETSVPEKSGVEKYLDMSDKELLGISPNDWSEVCIVGARNSEYFKENGVSIIGLNSSGYLSKGLGVTAEYSYEMFVFPTDVTALVDANNYSHGYGTTVMTIGRVDYSSNSTILKGDNDSEHKRIKTFKDIRLFVLPAPIAIVEANAFQAMDKLERVVLNSSIKDIEQASFAECSNLKQINLPSSLEYISEDAFENCPNIIATVDEGSYAESWCKKNNIEFILSGNKVTNEFGIGEYDFTQLPEWKQDFLNYFKDGFDEEILNKIKVTVLYFDDKEIPAIFYEYDDSNEHKDKIEYALLYYNTDREGIETLYKDTYSSVDDGLTYKSYAVKYVPRSGVLYIEYQADSKHSYMGGGVNGTYDSYYTMNLVKDDSGKIKLKSSVLTNQYDSDTEERSYYVLIDGVYSSGSSGNSPEVIAKFNNYKSQYDSVKGKVDLLNSESAISYTDFITIFTDSNNYSDINYSTEVSTEKDPDYILPDCDSRYYSQEELEALSAEQLKLARNEIYARHGYIFHTGDTKNYFDSKSWYRGTVTEVTDDMLNEYEIANRDLIISIENK